MANVQLTITALPSHVRTARLLATAVARRAGIGEATLDEVRLAVGEACSRAVETHQVHCPHQPIRLELIDGGGPQGARTTGTASSPTANNGSPPAARAGHGKGRFEVIVSDCVPPSEATERENGIPGAIDSYLDLDTPAGGVSGLPMDVGLAVIVGLADHVTIEPGDTGTVVRLSWPLNTGGPAAGEDRRGHTAR